MTELGVLMILWSLVSVSGSLSGHTDGHAPADIVSDHSIRQYYVHQYSCSFFIQQETLFIGDVDDFISVLLQL